jgi:hypothetical protein
MDPSSGNFTPCLTMQEQLAIWDAELKRIVDSSNAQPCNFEAEMAKYNNQKKAEAAQATAGAKLPGGG